VPILDDARTPMSATGLSRMTKPARVAAMLLTLSLFAVGSFPAAGQAFPGAWHLVAHLAAYALIALTFGVGWPQRPAAHLVVLVAAIGAIHETSEVLTHSHAFETNDVVINAIGALIGVAIQRAIWAETEWTSIEKGGA
jgi:VanZ family protein